MRILSAEILIDGSLHRGVVIDFASDGRLLSFTPLSALPCEPANTVYVGDRLEARCGSLTPDSLAALGTLFAMGY